MQCIVSEDPWRGRSVRLSGAKEGTDEHSGVKRSGGVGRPAAQFGSLRCICRRDRHSHPFGAALTILQFCPSEIFTFSRCCRGRGCHIEAKSAAGRARLLTSLLCRVGRIARPCSSILACSAKDQSLPSLDGRMPQATTFFLACIERSVQSAGLVGRPSDSRAATSEQRPFLSLYADIGEEEEGPGEAFLPVWRKKKTRLTLPSASSTPALCLDTCWHRMCNAPAFEAAAAKHKAKETAHPERRRRLRRRGIVIRA